MESPSKSPKIPKEKSMQKAKIFKEKSLTSRVGSRKDKLKTESFKGFSKKETEKILPKKTVKKRVLNMEDSKKFMM